MHLIVCTDGGARGNPGPAAIGASITDLDGTELDAISEYIGETTNNVAEYTAAILGLERAAALGATSVELRTDSLLLVRQLAGRYRVKAVHLQPLHRRVQELAASFERVRFVHVPRGMNVEADRLANLGVDRGLGLTGADDPDAAPPA
jgi:ribonuclease HI